LKCLKTGYQDVLLLSSAWYDTSHSTIFSICFDVRQKGSVLSPYLFSVYIDDVGKLNDFRNGCFVLL